MPATARPPRQRQAQTGPARPDRLKGGTPDGERSAAPTGRIEGEEIRRCQPDEMPGMKCPIRAERQLCPTERKRWLAAEREPCEALKVGCPDAA